MTKETNADHSDGLVAPGETSKLDVVRREDEKIGRTLARVTLDPKARNASLAMSFGSQMFGDQLTPNATESSAVLDEEITKVIKGDLSLVSQIYTSQAISLDSLFTEMARRSGKNMGSYPDAAERYMRLALKAQSACRSTLDALARLHQPREQTVKHVHVNEGGQAIVADQFHQHTGVKENGKSVNQSHATATVGQCATLPCPDASGNCVPVSRRKREKALQDAWRHKSGCP